MAVNCTRPTELTDISKVLCAVHFGQIVRLAFRRRLGVTAPAFATEAAMKTQAAWNSAITAEGNDKIILSPLFVNFVIPPSEAQFLEENTNGSINGKGYLAGYNAVKPTGEFVGLPGDVKAQLELIEEEARAELGEDPMEQWGITADNRIISVGAAGIPFSNFYIGSVGSEGFRALNKNAFGFSLDGKWDKGLTVTQAEFDLVNLYPAP
ncbi:hypothetical protein [Hymenobacter sediminicola]|uniref:Uncharacterized protein n=1 Tax=Hymenobacter sediminicola TaxID=2761579 RepID=A0A7G7W2Z4_9BACT|nr:hypothetical protein [Hymenobacter sediminicola]QNH60737.1 hypothetical protein H4317_11095 [Hymenobacter sediminicola]